MTHHPFRPENTLAARLRQQHLRAAAEAPDAKPWHRVALLELLAQSDPAAAAAGLEREIRLPRPPDGALLQLLNLRISQGDAAEVGRLCDRIEVACIARPFWLDRFLDARRTGLIDLDGTTLAVPPDVVDPVILRSLAQGTYEYREMAIAGAILRDGDRVLEMGAGLGAVACASLRRVKGVAWKSVEANPSLLPVIARNRALNGVDFELEHAAYGPTDGPVQLWLSPKGMWSSSLHGEARGENVAVSVPGVDGAAAIAAYAPNVLIMDIEGAEYGILERLDLAGIDRLLVEFHPDMANDAIHSTVLGHVLSSGLVIDTKSSLGNVMLFRRP